MKKPTLPCTVTAYSLVVGKSANAQGWELMHQINNEEFSKPVDDEMENEPNHHKGALPTRVEYKKKSKPPRNPVPEGSMTLKQWLSEESERLGIKPHALFTRLSRNNHQYPGVEFTNINKRVVFVKRV